MGSHREEAEPEAAGGGPGKASGIAGQIAVRGRHRSDLLPLERNMTDAMAPAFGKPQRLFISRNAEAMGIGEVAQQDGRPVKPRSTTDQPPQPVLLQKIGAPILRDVPAAAVAQENVAIRRRRDTGQAVERLIAGLLEPGLFTRAIDGSQTMTGNAHEKPAVRMKCKPAGIALEVRKDFCGRGSPRPTDAIPRPPPET